MAKITDYTNEQWFAGPTTPGARHFFNYTNGIASGAFKSTSQDIYYAQNAVFHNTNGATYQGAGQIQPWMREVFSPFSKVSHQFLQIREIDVGDGKYTLYLQAIRQLWLKTKGEADGREPDVNVPSFVMLVVGADTELASDVSEEDRLRILDMWLYWDTGMLTGLVPEDATLFKTKNIFEDGQR